MITNYYRGDRFPAGDLPLIDSAQKTIDEIHKEGLAEPVLEVMSGVNYRRPIVDAKLANVAYLLQVVMSPIDRDIVGSWCEAGEEVITRFRQSSRAAGADKIISTSSWVDFPEEYGPFGSPDASRLPAVYQPILLANHTTADGRATQLRVGVQFKRSPVMFDTYPSNCWENSSVRGARRGEIVIPDPDEQTEQDGKQRLSRDAGGLF